MTSHSVNDSVVSTVCPIMIGKVAKVIDNVHILIKFGSKEVLGHVGYWRKQG